MIGLPHIRLAMGFVATLSLRSGLQLRMTEGWLSACNTKVIARTPIYRGAWQSQWCSVMICWDCRVMTGNGLRRSTLCHCEDPDLSGGVAISVVFCHETWGLPPPIYRGPNDK